MRYEREFSVKKTLYKDNINKKVSGVCGGIAKYYGLPRLGVRIATVAAMFMFPMVVGVAYVVAAILVPNRY